MADIRINPILSAPFTRSALKHADQAGSIGGFSQILDDAVSADTGIKFSKHAISRLESRNISMDENDLQKLNTAVESASDKGLQDSLILMNGLAFIVSVPDKTVVTAMPIGSGENIFTNIDGAVIA